MKTRTVLIIVLVVALLAVYGFIGMDYLNQRNQRELYDTQIAEIAAALAQIPQRPVDLEARLAAAQDSLEEAKNVFVLNATSIELLNNILSKASESGMNVVPVLTQSWVQVSVSDQIYSVFRVEITASGTLSQLAVFLHQLEHGELKTLIIESLVVTGVEGSSLLESSERDSLTIAADISIAIYAVPTDGG
jgi:Tfp pilus assembly protein PilO